MSQSRSLLPPLGLRTAETRVRKGRRKQWHLRLPAGTNPLPLLFSYHIQPCTIIFSMSTWACEAHESLPWSCNLSCNRWMRIVLQEQLCVWVIPQVIAQIPPHSVQTVPYYSHRVPVLVVKAEKKRPHRRRVCAFINSVSSNETNETGARSVEDWVGSWLHSAVGAERTLWDFLVLVL